eukprot:4008228-Amphidinium_carterae.1
MQHLDCSHEEKCRMIPAPQCERISTDVPACQTARCAMRYGTQTEHIYSELEKQTYKTTSENGNPQNHSK